MNIEKAVADSNLGTKIINRIKKLKHGEGLTKKELSEAMGYTSSGVVEKWFRKYPEINNYKCYVIIRGRMTRQTIFVNLKYKQKLIQSGKATENY